MLLFGLFILLFALLGLHLFGGRYDSAIRDENISEVPAYHFNTLWMSIVTVFQVRQKDILDCRWCGVSTTFPAAPCSFSAQLVVTEDFKETVTLHMAAFGTASVIYFVCAIVLGHCMFLAIFLAVFVHELEHGLHREYSSKGLSLI